MKRAKFVELGEGGADDLVHVVIAVCSEAADEGDAGLGGGARGVFLVEGAGVGSGNGVIGLAAGAVVVGVLANDGGQG